MTAKLFIILYSLIVNNIPSNNASVDEIPIIYIEEEPCSTEGNKCDLDYIRDELTMLHNAERKRTAISSGIYQDFPIATDMLLMVRDSELEHTAQTFAKHCIQNTIPKGKCRKLAGIDMNVSMKTHKEKSDLETRLQRVIQDWIPNLDDYNDTQILEFVKSFKITARSVRNLAFIIHAKVWKIGCRFVDLPIDDDEYLEAITCFYGPPKLSDGVELYRHGCEACSHCPNGTLCVEEGEFEGALCEVTGDNDPIYDEYDTEEEICTEPESTAHDEEPLWNCTLENYGDQCVAERSCSPDWEIDTDGGFKSIKVLGTCITVSMFKRVINIEEPSCFKFQYIKEDTRVPSFQSNVIGFATQVNKSPGHSISKSESKNTNEWTDIKLDIPWTEENVQVGVVVRSRSPSGGEQEIKVRDFVVFTGSCS